MLFAVHEDERITQANKVYEPDGYDKQLLDLGYKFVMKDTMALPSPEQWHVRNGSLKERPQMFIVVSRTIIKAGGVDAAILRGCPIGATFAVMADSFVIDSGTLDDPDLEVPSLVPCKMQVIIDRWPYQTFKLDIEATA
jgi:hypothetical protein